MRGLETSAYGWYPFYSMLTLDNISAIFFDLDGTLRHSVPSSTELFHRLAQDDGLLIGPETVRASRRWICAYWAQSDELLEDIEASDGDDDAFWVRNTSRHLEVLGMPPSEKLDEKAAIIHARMKEMYQPIDRVPEDVPPTLALLRQAGFRLGLVSNRDLSLIPVVRSIGLEENFDLILAAGEVGWWKPDPRLLRYAASIINVPPEAILYVGDNYFTDIIGARAAGMHSVLIDPQGIFPEADCHVINEIGELACLLNKQHD